MIENNQLTDVHMKNMNRSVTILEVEQKNQRKLTILIGSMTLAFYATWAPYAITCILVMAGVSLPHTANVIAILFAKFSVVINPTIYIFMNTDVSNFG